MNSPNIRTKFLIAGAIVLGGIGLAGYQLHDFLDTEVPQMQQEVQKIELTLSGKEAELKKLRDFAQNIEKVKQELKELNVQLESALEHMPRSFNLSAVLRKFTLLAQNSGLEVTRFKPEKDEKKEGFYSSINIEFDAKGTFSQTLLFLDQLARLKRIVNVQSLKLTAPDEKNQKSGLIVLSTSAKVKTYRFSE